MKVEFIVDWGYRHIYFGKRYLPEVNFDGKIEVFGGKLLDVKRLQFKKDRVGTFVQTPNYSSYGKSEWKSLIHNNYDGFLFTVEGNENTSVSIITNSATKDFTLGELFDKGHITVDTDNPFLFTTMLIYLKEHEWYIAKKTDEEIRVKGSDFNGKQDCFFGVNGVIVGQDENVKANFQCKIPHLNDGEMLVIEGAIRTVQSKSTKTDIPVTGIADFSVKLNGEEVYHNSKFSFNWDDHSTHLEESFFSVPINILNTNNTIEILNQDKCIVILAQMVRFFVRKIKHLQILRCPKWVIADEPFSVKIFATHAAVITIRSDDDIIMCSSDGKCDLDVKNRSFSCEKGENEFFFKAINGGENKKIYFCDERSGKSSIAGVGEVWDTKQELIEPKTGIEVRIDYPQDYLRYIDKMIDERMGNYVLFRKYRNEEPSLTKLWDAAALCKEQNIYTDIITFGTTNWLAETVANASGNYNFAVGSHESTGIFYWGEWFDNPSVKTMDDAERISIKELSEVCNALRVGNSAVAVGDASGGPRYAYRAGFDIIRHETYCANHLTILPIARGTARAYGKEVWGAHIASQHNFQIELETAIGRYWLSMFLPWVFGANFVYEEDSLFQNNKYYRMVNDDYITKEKQKVTAEYFKHIKTHSRKGSPQVDIGFIQGRFEPPFTAISGCNAPMELKYSGEDCRIWGKNGSPKQEWGHRQPEKGLHLLEVVAPQIYLPPLSQNPYRVRKLFCSDPYGEFDFLPIEAPQNVYSQYKILFMLGWNTMCEKVEGVNSKFANDYYRLKNYVENGGTIVLSVSQLSMRTDRELLSDMENANLYNDGDVRDLFGVIVGKPCEEFSESIYRGIIPKKNYNEKCDFIRLPSNSVDEDGDCSLADVKLCGAQICLEDKASGKPLLIRYKIGKGYAYLLCVYAYPGHEKLKYLSANIMRALIQLHVSKDVYVRDENDMVYWSDWKDGDTGKLYLLNTDWTAIDNKKTVSVFINKFSFDCYVKEREVKEIAYCKESAVYTHASNMSVNAVNGVENTYEICGFGEVELSVFASFDFVVKTDGQIIKQYEKSKLKLKLRTNGKTMLFLNRLATTKRDWTV